MSERVRLLGAVTALFVMGGVAAACAPAQPPQDAPAPAPEVEPADPPAADMDDPRVGLDGGWRDAEVAARGIELIATRPRPEGFADTGNLGNLLFANSDIAFRGDLLFLGSFRGFQIWDISDPADPTLRTAVLCPGGQGDLSVWEDLLFMSVEMPNGRIDCGTEGTRPQGPDPERFRGVRVFDISDLDEPRQVAAVQTCRGSHTHTLVPDASDPTHVYIYNSGTSSVRPAAELAGCVAAGPEEDPETAFFRIEVIHVLLERPEDAAIVNAPRIFADPETGDIAGLWPGGAREPGAQQTATTNQCHDITAFPEIGLAAGACSGNGILLDISDPENPERVEEVFDPNFAYWHSATFDNEGTKVVFTDEWGGGTQARCRATDPREWGANAIFTMDGTELEQRSYYKLPAPQSAVENCVAHNGSIIPVPGRDIMVQAWYQGGVSIFDFTDPENPFEIAYFDRGPLDEGRLLTGGQWSSYWYNGRIYGSEISRGLDVFRLTPTEHLSQAEIDAAESAVLEIFNPQTQPRITWPDRVAVARALLDQLRRGDAAVAGLADELTERLDAALEAPGAERADALVRIADAAEGALARASGHDARRLGMLSDALTLLAEEEEE